MSSALNQVYHTVCILHSLTFQSDSFCILFEVCVITFSWLFKCVRVGVIVSFLYCAFNFSFRTVCEEERGPERVPVFRRKAPLSTVISHLQTNLHLGSCQQRNPGIFPSFYSRFDPFAVPRSVVFGFRRSC